MLNKCLVISTKTCLHTYFMLYAVLRLKLSRFTLDVQVFFVSFCVPFSIFFLSQLIKTRSDSLAAMTSFVGWSLQEQFSYRKVIL